MKLEWVEQRMEALDEIEDRLREMRESWPSTPGVNDLGSAETQEINDKLQAIQEQVTELGNKNQGILDGLPVSGLML